jgi:RNA polymerase-interacting CarD/CdnL/TRCF family regulator
MLLTFGSKIVYPSLGPCLVLTIVKRIIDDTPLQFYQLRILSGGGEIFVPVDGFRLVGVRPLLERSEIPRLLERLKEPMKVDVDNRHRHLNILLAFDSGSAFNLAEVVETLTELAETKTLSVNERHWLNRAKCQLVCEIAEVMNLNRETAEAQVDYALKARPQTRPLRPVRRTHSVNRVHPMQESSGDHSH